MEKTKDTTDWDVERVRDSIFDYPEIVIRQALKLTNLNVTESRRMIRDDPKLFENEFICFISAYVKYTKKDILYALKLKNYRIIPTLEYLLENKKFHSSR